MRLCSPEYLDDEIHFIFDSLSKLGYPSVVLKKSLSKAKSTFFSSKPSNTGSTSRKYMCVPFVQTLHTSRNHHFALSFNHKLVFKFPNNIRSAVVHKSKKANCGIYSIPCKDCDKFYVGETGRSFQTRFIEHRNAIVKFEMNNALAHHSHNTGHVIDFQNSKILCHCNNLHVRKVLESAFIKINQQHVLNQNEGFCQHDALTASRLVRSDHC